MGLFDFFKKEISPPPDPENETAVEKPEDEAGDKNNDEERIDEGRRWFVKTGSKAVAGAGLAATGLPAVAEAAGRFLKKDQSEIDKIRQEIRRDAGLDGKTEPVEKSKSAMPEKKEITDPEELVKHILELFEEDDAVKRRLPPDIFKDSFFIAHQFVESRYQADSESRSGAQGVYQVKPEATIEVGKFLNILRNKKILDNYQGPKEIDKVTAKKIGDLFKKNDNYGRVIGKFYLLCLYDEASSYNNHPNEDAFRGQSLREVQRRLLVAYHDGPRARFKTDEQLAWDARKRRPEDSAVHYYESVFRIKKLVDYITTEFERNNLKQLGNYASVLILRELDRRENRRKDPLEVINMNMKKVLFANRQSLAQNGRPLANTDIRRIFDPDYHG